LPEITPAQEGLRVHHHQLHLVNEATFRPNAAQRPAFSRALREKSFIEQFWSQNTSDLGEQAKRSASAGMRC